jgi:endonuclease-8
MPEGPTLLILKEELKRFEGKIVRSAEGYAKIDFERLQGKKIKKIASYGKHLIIAFKGFYIRIHLLMFGSYRINERRPFNPKLSLIFSNQEVDFYTCSVVIVEGDPDENYDWERDVLSEKWDPAKAMKTLKEEPEENVCDALLDQEIFAGVGNIIKNEVLFRVKIHPKSIIGKIPGARLKKMVNEASSYSWDFYQWKKEFVLSKHWQIYKKATCPLCGRKTRKEYLGKGKRRTFFCNHCQVLYK